MRATSCLYRSAWPSLSLRYDHPSTYAYCILHKETRDERREMCSLAPVRSICRSLTTACHVACVDLLHNMEKIKLWAMSVLCTHTCGPLLAALIGRAPCCPSRAAPIITWY